MHAVGTSASVSAAAAAGPRTAHGFEPYADNGGSALAIAGRDFVVLAADTRQSDGYAINSRAAPKTARVTGRAALAATGFFADGAEVCRVLGAHARTYRYAHEKELGVSALAHVTMNVLYSRRFFPYYAHVLLAGIDESGAGAVFSFDPVGSFEREVFRATGSAAALMQPLLDAAIGLRNRVSSVPERSVHGTNVDAPLHPRPELTAAEAVALARDAFAAAAERDIYTGDAVQVLVITSAGVSEELFPLRRD